ncbi:VOC family protein [Nocardioides aquaticus]|uniref:VOC family protein n=1 Tax=Nocardioides aquaticus TaxID=160826 RepID=UPI001BD29FDE|nr:VOC family protein [Nocardioides aquaticus]
MGDHPARDARAWSLVRDQAGETAVQAHRRPEDHLGGDAVAPTLGRNRLHLDLVPSAPSTLVAEVERLVALGASRVDVRCADGIGMADPGGNEFCVVG